MTQIPQPGDAVILTGYHSIVGPGTLGIIGGTFATGASSIGFNAGAYRDDSWVSLVGGPITRDIPLLIPTGLTHRQRYWRFRDGQVAAGGGEEYYLDVPLWAFAGELPTDCWCPELLEVPRLLSDRSAVFNHLDMFPLPDKPIGSTFRRGDYLLEVVPGDNFDTVGQELIQAFNQRKLVMVFTYPKPDWQGRGFTYQVRIGSDNLVEFTAERQLHDWMSAYGLSFYSGPVPHNADCKTIIPPSDSSNWQPLQ